MISGTGSAVQMSNTVFFLLKYKQHEEICCWQGASLDKNVCTSVILIIYVSNKQAYLVQYYTK